MKDCLSFTLGLFTFGLARYQNVDSLSLFYRYYFGRCSSDLAQLVPLPYSPGKSTCYSDRLHDFSVTIPRCCKNVHVNSFFSCTVRLQTARNFLPIKYFSLTYDLNGIKSGINIYFLTVGLPSHKSRTLAAIFTKKTPI